MLDLVITIAYSLLFIVLLRRIPFFQGAGLSANKLTLIYLLKFAAGCAVYLIYTVYYADRATADIFKYFDDSKVMHDALWSQPIDFFKMFFGVGNDTAHFDQYYQVMNNWTRVYESNLYNDSHTIIRFNAFVRLFSFGVYHVHTAFMCFISMIGLTGMYKFLLPHFDQKKTGLLVAVFLIPSVVFWGSGVLKEGLLFLGLGVILYNYGAFIHGKFTVGKIAATLVALLLLLFLKFYVLAALLAGLSAHAWVTLAGNKGLLWKYGTVLAVCSIAVLNFHLLFPSLDFLDLLVTKQKDFLGLSEFMQSGSIISVSPLEPTFWSFLKAAPHAFVNAYFRPLPFESMAPFILLAGLENLVIILLIIAGIAFRKSLSDEQKNLVLMILVSTTILFLLIGWVTPVMGAIVRYKVPMMPLFAAALVMVIDIDKLIRKIPFFNFLKR